jgi:hypothetical protein
LSPPKQNKEKIVRRITRRQETRKPNLLHHRLKHKARAGEREESKEMMRQRWRDRQRTSADNDSIRNRSASRTNITGITTVSADVADSPSKKRQNDKDE